MRGSCLIFKMVVLLFAAALLIPAKSLSQSRFRDWGYVSFGIDGGIVIPNEPSDSPVLGGVGVAGFNVGVGARMVGTEYWKDYWNYPYFGIKVGYEHITSTLVGERFSLGASLEMPFFRSERMGLGAFFDFGFSYLTNTYDSVSNPDNLFIGSHLNALISLGFCANWQVGKRTTLYSQLAFSHSSNGTVQLPNKGINIARLEVGAKVNFAELRHLLPCCTVGYDDTVENGTKNRLFINVSPVYNSSRKTWEHYFSASASIGYRRKFHPCFAYGGGVDFMYDASLEKAHEPHLPENNYAVSAYGLLEAYWGRFSLRGAVGYYAWRGCDFALPFYERIGVYYSFGKRVRQYVGASIKAHAAHAQFLEWTYGVELFRF
ncbi:MAG: acyloxyacyl hydrolase [Bacteroidales bacterium]|nr:acyloxyacyl hydrolase [Bacteroidales bacterium]